MIVKVNEDLRTTEHRKVYRAKAMTKGHGAKQILEYASLILYTLILSNYTLSTLNIKLPSSPRSRFESRFVWFCDLASKNG